MNHKYAILRLDIMKLTKIITKDELKDMIKDLEKEGIPISVYKNHGEIWSEMEIHTS